jgi:two-component system, NarL family, sensor histidine kinase UhpB
MDQVNDITILIIEDNPGDLLIFEEYLKLTSMASASLYKAQSLTDAFNILARYDMQIVFLDLSLPDVSGIKSFTSLNEKIKHTPVVVLSGLSSTSVALECITLGAQDYLLKDDLTPALLEKSINYSIERKKNLEKISRNVERYEMIGSITNDIIWHWNFITNEIKSPSKEFFDYKLEDVKSDIEWWKDRIHPHDRESVFGALENLLNGKAESAQSEYRFKCAIGLYRYVFNRVHLLRDDNGVPVGIIGAMMDLTEMKSLEDRLTKQQLNHQKQLIEASLIGQEKEKEQIGKELHDNINQVLASIKLYIETSIKHEHLREELLLKCRENTIYAIDEIRKLSHSLVIPSLGDHGLIAALQELRDELNATGEFIIHLKIENVDETSFDNNKKIMIYRIVQEQINNIIKYAKASDIFIHLKTYNSHFMLIVSDNGVGFNTAVKPRGIGLKNIESRVSYYSGEMQLTSEPGKGTSLEIVLPLGQM